MESVNYGMFSEFSEHCLLSKALLVCGALLTASNIVHQLKMTRTNLRNYYQTANVSMATLIVVGLLLCMQYVATVVLVYILTPLRATLIGVLMSYIGIAVNNIVHDVIGALWHYLPVAEGKTVGLRDVFLRAILFTLLMFGYFLLSLYNITEWAIREADQRVAVYDNTGILLLLHVLLLCLCIVSAVIRATSNASQRIHAFTLGKYASICCYWTSEIYSINRR